MHNLIGVTLTPFQFQINWMDAPITKEKQLYIKNATSSFKKNEMLTSVLKTFDKKSKKL